MIKNQIVWAKTLLAAYKYLGTMCNAIDRAVEKLAQNSFYSCGVWREENSITNISKKIISLSNKKVDYINLKVVVEKAVKLLSEKGAKILILKFIQGLDNKTIIQTLNMADRTYYRKLNSAAQEFASKMTAIGYGVEKLDLIYGSDRFIKSIYDTISDVGQCDVLNISTLKETIFLESFINSFSYGLA